MAALFAMAAFADSAGARGAVAPSFSGRCVGVLDGDSIEVLVVSGDADGAGSVTHRIRLEGIDAPERGQPFSSRAKQTLSDLVFGQDVTVARVTTDRYGRLVARVHVGSIDTSLEMIRQGLAWHYKRYSSEQALVNAESVARARRVGLWADPDAVPPWSYRRGPASPR